MVRVAVATEEVARVAVKAAAARVVEREGGERAGARGAVARVEGTEGRCRNGVGRPQHP